MLRLLLVGLLLVFSWGLASAVSEEVRSDDSTSQTIARSSGARVAANRFSGDVPDFPALPAVRIELFDADAGDDAVATTEPRTPVRSRPADPARLPRGPPAAPSLSI